MIEEKQDNLRVKPIVQPQRTKMTKEQIQNIEQSRLKNHAENTGMLYDLDKYKLAQAQQHTANTFFLNPQPFYNDKRTSEGQARTQANFDYANNIADVVMAAFPTTAAIGASTKLVKASKAGKVVGTMESLTPFKIGEGAESVVFKNSLTTVGKITNITEKEMNSINNLPGMLKSKIAGYVRDGNRRLNVFIQNKVKPVDENNYLHKLQKFIHEAIQKGYKFIQHEDGTMALTDGTNYYLDLEKNFGLTKTGKLKLFDVSVLDKEGYKAVMGFKKGGKWIPKQYYGRVI